MPLPPVASLWIGESLSYLEQVCLKSFVDHGHETVLFAYGAVGNVPDGVTVRDAAEIFPGEDIIRHRRTGSPAFHADAFRYRLVAGERVVWVDADMLCVRPWEVESPWVFGWEKPRKLVCNAVVGLPGDSETLRRLNDFCRDEYPIPPWAKDDERRALEAAAAAGDPVHVADLKWGVWGPAAMTWFLTETGEIAHVRPQKAFFPVPFKDRRDLLDPSADIGARLGEGCLGVHLWNRRLRRRLVTVENGVPHPDSFLGRALARHGIDPEAAPIPDDPPVRETEQQRAPTSKRRMTPPDLPRARLDQTPLFQRAIDQIEAQGDRTAGFLDPPDTPPSADRILVVTSMKNEAPFILEWIAYHLSIGVTHFLVYTNGCADPTNAILDRLAVLGVVTRIDNPCRPGTDEKPQHAALKDAATQDVCRAADWRLTIDVDEFLNVHVGQGTIRDFLAAANHPNVASFTWKFFGNAGTSAFEDRPLIERFTRCAPEALPHPRLGWGFKSMVHRSAPYRGLGVHRPLKPHKHRLDEVRWVNGSGRVMPETNLTRGWRSTTGSLGYRLATLNHYVLRSAESFLVKRERGRINHTDQDQGVHYFRRRNYGTETDDRILSRVPAMRERLDAFLADPELAALHAKAVDWHKARAEILKSNADYRGIWDEITRRDIPDALYLGKDGEPKQKLAAPAPVDRYANVTGFAAARGGFFRKGAVNAAAFVPGDDRLVVTFDDQRHARTKGARWPADFAFLHRSLGTSILGVFSETRNWYREGFVHDLFDGLSAEGFFTRFRRTLFVGAGMGGFAALSYARAAPGASVLAFAPQSTMDRRVVPWEARWGWTAQLDWSDRYADAADALAIAGPVTLVTDRRFDADRPHIARLCAPGVTVLNAPFMGAGLADHLRNMGLLERLVADALDGGIDPARFARDLRARHTSPAFREILARRAESRSRTSLASLARAVSREDAPLSDS